VVGAESDTKTQHRRASPTGVLTFPWRESSSATKLPVRDPGCLFHNVHMHGNPSAPAIGWLRRIRPFRLAICKI